MVYIFEEYKPVSAFVGSDVELECQVEGLSGNYVICCFCDDKKITQVDDVCLVSSDGASRSQKQRLFPSVGLNKDRFRLTITNAQELDEGIYSVGVYERQQDGNLSLTVKKYFAVVSVRPRYEPIDNAVQTSYRATPFEIMGIVAGLWETIRGAYRLRLRLRYR